MVLKGKNFEEEEIVALGKIMFFALCCIVLSL